MVSAFVRRAAGVLLVLFLASGIALTLSAQQTAGTAGQAVEAPAAPQAAAPAPPPVRPRLPEQIAYDGAMAMKDPFDKIEALQRIRSGFPKSAFLTMVDNSLLDVMVNNCPDRESEIGEVFDRVAKGTPTASAETRLILLARPVQLLVDKKLHLDKAQAAVESAMASIEPIKFFQSQIDSAKMAKQPEPTAAVVLSRLKTARGRGTELLGRIYHAKGDPRAEETLRDALSVNPTSSPIALILAGLEAKRGDESSALDHYLMASLGAKLKPADDTAMMDLFRKVRGPSADLNDALDRTYATAFPNPVTPTKWTPSPARSTRIVLAEGFTGSACGPCVSESLAFQALLERYPEDSVAAIAYHVHIPGPDPMTTSGSAGRKIYYEVKGVPTFNVDGALVKLGGGPRDNTPNVYADYVKAIDKALETAPLAMLDLTTASAGDALKATVKLSKVAADSKDLKLHVVLAERRLRFSGENGIRFHEMVVRAMAGKDGAGLAVDGTGDRTIEHTFDLAAARTDIVDNLAAEIAKRRKTEATGAAATPREYMAEGRAMTAFEAKQLVVIAFLQDGSKKVLQAVRADVK
jgi:hypothetical protein